MVLIVMLLAGLVAMQDAVAAQERTPLGQGLFTLFMPVPMVATPVLGLLIGPYRIPSLVFTLAALAAGMLVVLDEHVGGEGEPQPGPRRPKRRRYIGPWGRLVVPGGYNQVASTNSSDCHTT